MNTSRLTSALWLMFACSACTQVQGIALGSASPPSDDASDSGTSVAGDASQPDAGRRDDDDDETRDAGAADAADRDDDDDAEPAGP